MKTAKITHKEYQSLIPIAKQLREELKPFINTRYGRVFTERRKNGLRSKFWIATIADSLMFERVVEMWRRELNCNPYSRLSVRVSAYKAYSSYGRYGRPSVSIHISYK